MKKYTKAELAEMAKSYAKVYPKAKKMYATEDGNFFLTGNPAQAHANASKIELFELDMNTKDIVPSADDDPKEKAKARILEMDLDNEEDVDYAEIVTIMNTLNLAAEDKKKTSIIAALKNVKAELLTNKDQ